MNKESKEENNLKKEGLISNKITEPNKTIIKKKTVKIKEKECLILFVRNNKTFVKFDENHSLSVLFKNGDKAGDLIKIEYKGTLGNKDFKVI